MSTKVYHLYDQDNLNKDTLIKDTDFLDDAAAFLSDREGYTYNELDTDDKVYDAYMEHFRVQNVNEVTALKDMNQMMKVALVWVGLWIPLTAWIVTSD